MLTLKVEVHGFHCTIFMNRMLLFGGTGRKMLAQLLFAERMMWHRGYMYGIFRYKCFYNLFQVFISP